VTSCSASLGRSIGGWLFAQMGWGTPFSGLAGAIFVAFIGAVVLLVIIRLLRGARGLLDPELALQGMLAPLVTLVGLQRDLYEAVLR